MTRLKTVIENVNLLLQWLETLGDFRDMNLIERNFKEDLKEHLLALFRAANNLLEAKRGH